MNFQYISTVTAHFLFISSLKPTEFWEVLYEIASSASGTMRIKAGLRWDSAPFSLATICLWTTYKFKIDPYHSKFFMKLSRPYLPSAIARSFKFLCCSFKRHSMSEQSEPSRSPVFSSPKPFIRRILPIPGPTDFEASFSSDATQSRSKKNISHFFSL